MCPGKFGLLLNSELSGGSSCGQVDTFHTIQLTQDPEFEVDHVEVSTGISTVLFTKYFQLSIANLVILWVLTFKWGTQLQTIIVVVSRCLQTSNSLLALISFWNKTVSEPQKQSPLSFKYAMRKDV